MLPRTHVEVLLYKAAQDEQALRALRDRSDVAVDIYGFHAQQAAEKLLKAAVRAGGGEPPMTHRLAELLDLLTDMGVHVPAELAEVRTLTPFAVQFRYDIILAPDEEGMDREACLEMIVRLRSWVETLLEPVDPER